MKPAMEAKLQHFKDRYEELKKILSDHKVTEDLNRYRDLSKEYAQLEPKVYSFNLYQDYAKQLQEAKIMLKDEDLELQQLAKQEIKQIEESMQKIEEEL